MIARRIATAVAAAACLAAVVWAAGLPAAPVPTAQPTAVSVAAAPVQIACPGPVAIPVGETDTGDESLDSGSSDRLYRELAIGAEPTGAGFRTWSEAGTSIERIGTGDVAGLAATGCDLPSHDQWLVGGATTLGASARLVLTNPATAATEATIELYGPLGRVDERTVVSVAASGQVDMLLEGVAAELATLAVHVRATGAGVVASLQDSRLDGFQPAGTDWVAPGSAPATRLVIPAVGPSTPSTPATVRLLAPEGATVTLTLLSPDGRVDWGGVTDLVLEPGVATDLAVPDVESAAVTIDADAPVVAAAMTRIARAVTDGPSGARAYDLTWTAARAVDGGPYAAVVPAFADYVTVYAERPTDFRLVSEDGTVVATTTLSGHSAARLPLGARAGTVVTAEGDAVWVIEAHDAPGFLTTVAPRPTAVEPVQVTVRPRVYVGRDAR